MKEYGGVVAWVFLYMYYFLVVGQGSGLPVSLGFPLYVLFPDNWVRQ